MKQLIPLIFSLAILGLFLIGCESISDPETVSDALFPTGETSGLGKLSDGITKEMCMDVPGWEALGFRNQGQCVRYVETGNDSREGFSISGTVTYSMSSGLEGVTITASGDYSQTVTTNTDGQYIISGVPMGANVTITPSFENYVFIPPDVSVENISQNITDIDFDTYGDRL